MGIIEYISIGSIIISVGAFILKTFQSKNARKNTVERSNKIITLISEIIPQAITFAEKNGNSGDNKKILALSKILLDCAKSKIDYEEQAENIDITIEKLIEFSKEVNAVKVSREV